MQDRIIKFDIDKIEFIEEINNSQFARVKLWFFASGDNLHNLPVGENILQERAETIYDKPLVWCYSKFTDDAMGHEKEQIPCGFVPRQNNPIIFERNEDGRLFTIVEALIWVYYSGKILEIFERDDGKKSVSVEIRILETQENEDKQTEITDYCYQAITILGEDRNPAIPLAHAEILEFAEAKKQVEELLFSESNSDINFQEKEDEIMTFNKEEFATKFSMTANNMRSMLCDAVEAPKYMQGEYEYCKYWLSDYDENYIYCYDEENGGKCAIPYSIQEGVAICDFDNAKIAKVVSQWIIIDEAEKEEEDMVFALAKKMAEKFTSDKKEEFVAEEETEDEVKTEEMECKDEKMSDEEDEQKDESEKVDMAEFSALKTQNETMSAELEQLKQFKADIEEKERMAIIEGTFAEVCDIMPQDKMDELRGRVEEFASIDGWVNLVKAEALPFAKQSAEKTKPRGFALPFTSEKSEEKSGSVWSRIKK